MNILDHSMSQSSIKTAQSLTAVAKHTPFGTFPSSQAKLIDLFALPRLCQAGISKTTALHLLKSNSIKSQSFHPWTFRTSKCLALL